MSAIDIIILLMVFLSAAIGLYNGLLKQLATILGLIVGLFIAKTLYLSVAEKISPFIETSMTVAQVISFIAIWLLVPIGFVWVAAILSKIMKAISLGWLDHLAGLVIGGVKSVIIISLMINLIDFIDIDNQLISETKKEESVLYYPIKECLIMFFPFGEEVIQNISV